MRGQGATSSNLGAAVCILGTSIPDEVKGLIRFVQLDESHCSIDVSVNGLPPGQHGLAIHQFGDFTRDWESCGSHYNPHNVSHGSVHSDTRHVGDLGNITVNPLYCFHLLTIVKKQNSFIHIFLLTLRDR